MLSVHTQQAALKASAIFYDVAAFVEGGMSLAAVAAAAVTVFVVSAACVWWGVAD